MGSSLRLLLDPLRAEGPELRARGMVLELKKHGAPPSNVKVGQTKSAKLEFLGRLTNTVRDQPTPTELPLGELTGQLAVEADSLLFTCDADSLTALTKAPDVPPEDDDTPAQPGFGPRALELSFGSTFDGIDVLGGEVPRLFLPDDVRDFRYLEVHAKLTLDGALEGDFDQNDTLDVVLGTVPPPRLVSNYPLQLFVGAAERVDEGEFAAWASSVFGNDVPLAAYQRLHKDALSGALTMPKIVLATRGDLNGELGDYNNDTRQIRVLKGLPLRAEDDQSEAAELFLVLLHEFGHHLDNLLRNKYSHVGGDAPGEEGALFAMAISGLDVAASDSLVFANYLRDGERVPLLLSYPEFQKAVQDYVADPAQQDAAKKNNVEAFSAGRGRPDSNFFAHRSIEDGLGDADSQFFTQTVRDQIYFGNWERDYSQFCGSSTLVALQVAAGPLVRSDLPRRAITEYLDRKAREEFSAIQPTRVTTTNLGVYRPEEHVDNPQGLTDDRSIDGDFRGPVTAAELAVDPATGIKNYIANDGKGWDTSTGYITSSLTKAFSAGLTAEGMRLLGQSLHTLEDLYAHSNFVELALIRLGNPLVFPWVGMKSRLVVHGDTRFPMVTGVFGFVDAMVSLLSSVGESLAPPVACEGKVFSKASVEALTLLLNSLLQPSPLEGLLIPQIEPIQVQKDQLSSDLTKFSQALCDAGEGTKTWIKRKLGAVLKSTLTQLSTFELDFMIDINTKARTDPTHSMLSKDHPDHPLHPIAAACARSAVKAVGVAMRDAWLGASPVSEPIRVATGFFVHPNDIPLLPGEPRADLLAQIDQFAKANPAIIKNLDAPGALNTFRKTAEAERKPLADRADEMLDHDDETMRRALAMLPNLDPHISVSS